MSISAENVRAMAKLARLAIDENDIPVYADQLNQILEFFAQMKAVDTTAIEPMAHPQDLVARLRPDRVTEFDHRELFQQGAPLTEDGLYLVPQVIE